MSKKLDLVKENQSVTVKFGMNAIFLLKWVVWGVYFKNLTGATWAPLSNFFY